MKLKASGTLKYVPFSIGVNIDFVFVFRRAFGRVASLLVALRRDFLRGILGVFSRKDSLVTLGQMLVGQSELMLERHLMISVEKWTKSNEVFAQDPFRGIRSNDQFAQIFILLLSRWKVIRFLFGIDVAFALRRLIHLSCWPILSLEQSVSEEERRTSVPSVERDDIAFLQRENLEKKSVDQRRSPATARGNPRLASNQNTDTTVHTTNSDGNWPSYPTVSRSACLLVGTNRNAFDIDGLATAIDSGT